MPYFPLFIDLRNKPVLIVGGGNVALRKLEKLLPYGPYITVLAPEVSPEVLAAGAGNIILDKFSSVYLKDQELVIAATNDRKLNHKIATICKDRKIAVNVVDNRDDCSFIFPALVRKGDVSVGISTGGASPTAAIWAKEKIDSCLPDTLGETVAYLDSVRHMIQEKTSDEQTRTAIYKRLFSVRMERSNDLSDEELEEIIILETNK